MTLIKDKKKVAKLDANGVLLEVYNSMSEAARLNNISLSSISQVCSGRRNFAGNFRWEIIFKEDKVDDRPILQYSPYGLLMHYWPSVSEAAKRYNIKESDLLRHLDGKTKTCNGCTWEYN